MICHVCGKEVPDGSAFCNSCGAQMPQDGAVVSQEPTETIQQSAMNPLEEQVLPEETQQADQPSLEPLAAQISSEDNKKKVKKYSKAIGIVSAALGIAIIVLIFLLLRSCKSGKNPATQVWSDWSDSLPANISADKYVIEEQTLYSSRTLETTASTEESALDGWELYDTIEGGEDYGPWSEWSDTEVAASDTRAVETQNLYRYRDKETTTDSSSTKDGWELEDTTYDYGNYGSWSNWSTTAVSKSESRQVETTTQYRYRDKKYKT